MTKKHILIIGATGGIGSAIVRALAKKDAIIFATGRDIGRLAKLEDDLKETKCEHQIYSLDLSDLKNIKIFENAFRKQNTRLDWIIYCSGHIEKSETTRLLEIEEVDLTMKLNLLAPIELTHLFEKYIREGGGVLFISSTAGIWGNGEYPIYSTAKGALNNFAKSLAKKWGGEKKSMAICPGPTNTPMREIIANDAANHQDPKEVAAVAEKLIYDNDSRMNGNILVVRNGQKSVLREELTTLENT